MVDKKRKERDGGIINGGRRKSLQSRSGGYAGKPKQKKGGDKTMKRTGPRLPNSLRKEINLLDSGRNSNSEDDEDVKSDASDELYEYEEAVPEEESKKNRRFDFVENFEYELPEQFQDENVASDEDEGEKEEEDEDRHARMLQGVTGLPIEAFQGKKKKNVALRSEAYTECEQNPSSNVPEGDGHISIKDLLEPLHGTSGFSQLRKSVIRMEKQSAPIHAPLPRADREKLERKVAYEQSKKVITTWEPLVKKHREASTLFFEEDNNLGFSTVGAIASEFEPRTEFEKKMASIIGDNKLMEAHQKDGARLLELNKISVEDVKDHQDRLAKMRSLLFRHELKSKRIKKIKSKTYHRLLKKDRLKAATDETSMNPEASKELARKQELKRAEERMTLKHKNNSKWAKRILKRGLDAQDDGTRAAISEQLHQHALLTRKMNSMKDSSSDEDSSEDDDDYFDDLDATNQDVSTKLLEKAKEKTLKVLEDADDVPKSGVLSLPFMVRGLKKKRETAEEEAKLAIDDYESSLMQLEDGKSAKVAKPETSSGRRIFGATKRQVEVTTEKSKVDNFYGNSDSEDNLDEGQIPSTEDNIGYKKEVNIDLDLLHEGTEMVQDPLFKDFEDSVKDPSSKTSYEVAIFASDTWQKMKNVPKKASKSTEKKTNVQNAVLPDQEDAEEVGDYSDSESEGQLGDGILNKSTKSTYKLPSQEELIRQAFAGDDVVMDFEKDKEGILNEEVPEPEKPVLLPGWGQWTDVQEKKGLPSWMLAEHESAKKKRDDALKKRKDAHLKHVVISERVDKKAEKLQTKTLPFPFTSKEAFEQSIRMPIGPEFNPVTTIGALNRPEIVKKTGMIIKPIKFEEVINNEKADERKRKRQTTKENGGANENAGDHKRKRQTTKEKGGARRPTKLKAKGIKVK